jgi:hypothetical protein
MRSGYLRNATFGREAIGRLRQFLPLNGELSHPKDEEMALFSNEERNALIAIRGVGPSVVARLESLGISTFHELAEIEPGHVCEQAAAETGSTCWRNSPLARKAISDAVAFAKHSVKKP